MRTTAERVHVIAEGAAACAVAAALSGRAGGGKIVAVVSGGNIDLARFAALVRRARHADVRSLHSFLILCSIAWNVSPSPLRSPVAFIVCRNSRIDLWWSWDPIRPSGLPPPRLPAVAIVVAQPGADAASASTRERLQDAAHDPEFLALYDEAICRPRRSARRQGHLVGASTGRR